MYYTPTLMRTVKRYNAEKTIRKFVMDDTKLILKKCAESSKKIKNSKKYHEVNQKQQKNRTKILKALCCYNHRVIFAITTRRLNMYKNPGRAFMFFRVFLCPFNWRDGCNPSALGRLIIKVK